jgi:hypothetical protein
MYLMIFRISCYVNVELQNPCIEIGQFGGPSNNGSKLVIDCGRLQVRKILAFLINQQIKHPRD